MDLHGRQRQFLDDLRVLDLQRIIECLALHQLGNVTGAGDGTAAAEGFEAGVFDDAVGVDLKSYNWARE